MSIAATRSWPRCAAPLGGSPLVVTAAILAEQRGVAVLAALQLARTAYLLPPGRAPPVAA